MGSMDMKTGMLATRNTLNRLSSEKMEFSRKNAEMYALSHTSREDNIILTRICFDLRILNSWNISPIFDEIDINAGFFAFFVILLASNMKTSGLVEAKKRKPTTMIRTTMLAMNIE